MREGAIAPPRRANTDLSATPCAHCGLPVPTGLLDPRAERQFCCHACETVYSVIRGCGLDQYYAIAREQSTNQSAQPARTTGRSYESFDDPAFHSLYCKPRADGALTTSLYLEGVHCAACVWLLERLPHVVPGVIEARLDFRRRVIALAWDGAAVPLSRIARFLDSLGYPAHPVRGGKMHEARRHEDRVQMVRIGIAGAIMGNVMLLSFALYSNVLEGAAMEAAFASMFRWLGAALAALSLAWPGAVFFRSAWTALKLGRGRRLNMDVPIAVGLAVGMTWGLVNTARGSGEVYFDTLTTLVFLLLSGRWVQSRQQHKAGDSVELLFSLTPTTARLVEAAGVREVPIEALRNAGTEAIVEVIAGSSVPVDGVVIEGSSDLDQSLLTGESRPVTIRPGEPVHAGAVNLSSPIRVRVSASGEDTRIGQLMRMVEECTRRRAPIVLLADRVANVFVWVVLTLALATALLWFFIDPSRAIDNAAALLIVTCPCALGLATPLAVIAAIGKAARRGLLIKGGDALQALGMFRSRARRGVLLLDKTGTLTEGRMSVVQWDGPEWIKPLVAAVERRCNHPVARALERLAPTDIDIGPIGLHHALGGGVSADIDGHQLLIGSARFTRERLGGLPGSWEDRVAAAAARGLTPIIIAHDREPIALAGVGDPLRADASSVVRRLRADGWDVRIVSGDHRDIVRAIGAELGLDPGACTGEASPEDKLRIVRELMSREHAAPVVMVGDGVNDAAALSAATVGVAVHGGAEASLAAADVYVSREGLGALAELIDGSERTIRAIKRCMRASLAYNVVFTILAMSGILSPLIAAILMPCSSLTVTFLAFRSRTFGGGGKAGEPCR